MPLRISWSMCLVLTIDLPCSTAHRNPEQTEMKTTQFCVVHKITKICICNFREKNSYDNCSVVEFEAFFKSQN